MSTERLTVLLVDDDPDYASLVQLWLSSASDTIEFVLNWTDSLASAKTRVEQGGIDAILLDLGLTDSDGMATFLGMRRSAPNLPIIVLSSADSESLAIQTIQAGAQDYLVKVSCTAELLAKTLQFAHLRHRCSQPTEAEAGAAGPSSRVICVIGAKGGVGATTFACVLAAELAAQTEQKVLLADLNMRSGLASFLMGLESKYSLVDALDNLDRLDAGLWASLVTRYDDNLTVIDAPGLNYAREVSGADLDRLLTFLRPLYDWIVLDLHTAGPQTANVLEHATEALVVTTTTIPALYQSKRLVDWLTRRLERDQVRLIINDADRSESILDAEIDKVFGAAIYARIPNDAKETQRALLNRVLPARASVLRRQVATVARRLAGIEEPKQKHQVPKLLSFLSRNRGAGNGAADRM